MTPNTDPSTATGVHSVRPEAIFCSVVRSSCPKTSRLSPPLDLLFQEAPVAAAAARSALAGVAHLASRWDPVRPDVAFLAAGRCWDLPSKSSVPPI
jgi:hypothetical protein